MEPTQQRVRELFDYHEDGYLIWKISNSNAATIGARAGTLIKSGKAKGKSTVYVDSKQYLLHRIIFLWHHGWLPVQVDHKYSIGDRIENLRDADNSRNLFNRGRTRRNRSGFKGVSWNKEKKKWDAEITANGVRTRLGRFTTAEEAHAAYCSVGRKLHGAFFNPG